MKYLLLTPPLTQLNTPYPATTVLKGFLQEHGMEVAQGDLGIELANTVLSKAFLQEVFANPASSGWQRQTLDCIDTVMRFLRGEDNTLAPRIANRSLLPEGPRFRNLADTEWAFGTSGTEDKARYLATLFVEDVTDYIRENVDSHFDLIRYAEHLANYAPTFDEMETALREPTTIIDRTMLALLERHIEQERPQIVGFAIPFPGCLYGALLTFGIERCLYRNNVVRKLKAVILIKLV